MSDIHRELVEGQKDWVSLTPDVLDVNALLQFAKSPKAGAVSSFLGTTREVFEDKEVVHLEYEAYNEMALQTMLEICDKVSPTSASCWNILFHYVYRST